MLAAGLASTFALLAFQLAQPWPLKWIFDVLAHDSRPAGFATEETALIAFTAAWVVIAIGAAGFEWVQLLVLTGLGNRVLRGFRASLHRHLLSQSLEFHEKREVGELLTRVVSDTARLRRGVNGVLLKGVHTVALFGATSAILLWLNPRLALVAAAVGIAGLAMMSGTGSRIVRAARRQRRREGRVAAVVEEGLSAIREYQTWRTGETADRRFERGNDKSFKEEQKVRRLEASLFLRTNLLLGAGVCAVLWLGAQQASAGEISAGDLVLFLTYMLSLYRPFNVFAHQSARTGRVLAVSDRLMRIMAKQPSIRDAEGAIEAAGLSGRVAFEGVTVRLRQRKGGRRRRILTRVSFAVEPGERIAVVGPNGAGKSTLLRLLPRLADPRSGHVLADGVDLRDYTLRSLRAGISSVQQEPVLFGLTVRENVALAAPDGLDDAALERVLARAQALDLVNRLPEKAETVLRRRGRDLSVGERQRLAIARALARNGALWLLDEPTTGLDAATAGELTQLLLEVTGGRTTFWVTHDLGTAVKLDRILLLVKGKVGFFGPPGALPSWIDSALAGETRPAVRRYYEQLRSVA